MGVYDSYGPNGTQLKVSNDGILDLRSFDIGDPVPLDDGVYLSSEIVIVVGGKLVAVLDRLLDKWGGEVDWQALVNERNPVVQAIQSLQEEEEWQPEDDQP